MHVEQTGLHAVLVGVVIDGWHKGKLVTGEYTQITCDHDGHHDGLLPWQPRSGHTAATDTGGVERSWELALPAPFGSSASSASLTASADSAGVMT